MAEEVVADIQLPIAVRLIAGGADELPELWVLHDQPLDQLRALARHTDDRLLARLSVAVGVADGQQIAVLRTNPGRGEPPVLVLDALPCRPHLRLPNLYLPVWQTLRPPLRRDAIRRLFAPDEIMVVWLEKDESGEVIANTLPEVAFRPLSEAIAYVQDRETRSLTPRVMDQLFSLPPLSSEIWSRDRCAANLCVLCRRRRSCHRSLNSPESCRGLFAGSRRHRASRLSTGRQSKRHRPTNRRGRSTREKISGDYWKNGCWSH